MIKFAAGEILRNITGSGIFHASCTSVCFDPLVPLDMFRPLVFLTDRSREVLL